MNTKPYNQKQQFLFPPRLEDFVPADHESRIINDVVDKLDFTRFYRRIPKTGKPSYHPKMMVKIYFYALCNGLSSSRKIAQRCCTDTAYIYLAGMQKPNFRTINSFRIKYRKELEELLVQITRVCYQLGLVNLQHVSVDGTKIAANASMSNIYDKNRAQREKVKIKQSISDRFNEINEQDNLEDKFYGEDDSGYEIPDHLKDPEKRLQQLDQLIGQLENEKEGKKRNLTDPQAEIQQTKGGKKSGYNGQVCVDSKHNVIVAADLTDSPSDVHQLKPLINQTTKNLHGKRPKIISCDAGYFSYENLEFITQVSDGYMPDRTYQHQIKSGNAKGQSDFDKLNFTYDPDEDVFICPAGAKAYPPERVRFCGHRYPLIYTIKGYFRCFSCKNSSECRASLYSTNNRTVTIYGKEAVLKMMRAKLQSTAGRNIYKMRKAIVETVFGALKQNMGFRRFTLRGKDKTRLEFKLWCIGYNLRKISLHAQV